MLLTINRHNYFIPKMNLKAIVANLEKNCDNLFDQLDPSCYWCRWFELDQSALSHHWYWFHSCGGPSLLSAGMAAGRAE